MVTDHLPFRSLVDLLRHWAAAQPDERAYAFVNKAGRKEDSVTFGELDRRASVLAAQLLRRGQVGDRVLLIFPAGLDFIAGYFGALYAGMLPVPMIPPKRNRLRQSTLSIVNNCRPAIGLSVDALVENLRREFAGTPAWDAIQWLGTDGAKNRAARGAAPHEAKFEDVAFLQYTSGSTSAPKGVMISHGNLLTNLEMIKRTLGNSRSSNYVSWVPLYHDMGLNYNVLQSLYLGTLCVLMAPASFVQRPLTWLSAISRYKAEVAGGPNFAYDLCVSHFKPDLMEGVDLSGWRLAFNGAEPVRADTLKKFTQTFASYGFDRRALYPCYGMAECTLLMSGGQREAEPVIKTVSRKALQEDRVLDATDGASSDRQDIVGCGSALNGERLAIVNPETLRECALGHVGEIWASGPHIARGYWDNPEATEETFRAYLSDTCEGPFLRTGDLGFMSDGEVYVTGRIKDMIIVRGQNHYPQDIEMTVAACHPALRLNHGAAFTVEARGEEKLVVVQEVERTWRNKLDVVKLVELTRKAVVNEHELMVYAIVFIKTGSLAKTSSGKIQRNLTRQIYLEGKLMVLGADEELAKVSLMSN